jgi:hypothetical protein
MKDLKVTGLAQESDFDNDGVVQFLLVLNKGALRIPISPEAAQEVIKIMYAEGNGVAEQQSQLTDEGGDSDEAQESPDDGVDQI